MLLPKALLPDRKGGWGPGAELRRGPAAKLRRLAPLPCFLLLALVSHPALARGDKEPAWAGLLPEDQSEEVVVAFAELEGQELPREYDYLRFSIPRVILQRVEVLEEHDLPPEEEAALRRRLFDDAVAELGVRLDELLAERDAVVFSEETRDERRARYRELEEEIEGVQEDIAALDQAEPRLVPLVEPKSITFRREEPNLLPPGRRLAILAEENDTDFVVGGLLEERDGYVFLEMEGYNAITGELVSLGGTAGRVEEIYDLLDPVVDEVATFLLGRPWGRLLVTTGIEDALILVEGEAAGFGTAELSYLEPGNTRVRVLLSGEQIYETEVVVEPFGSVVVAPELSVPEGERIALITDPPGADVYVDSIWTGTTPLLLDRPLTPTTAIVSKEEYLRGRVVLGPGSPNLIEKPLVEDIIDWEQEIQLSRDRFYRSLGWFVVSLPFPIILNGMYNNVASLYVDGRPPGLTDNASDELVGRANTLLWATRGTAAVSTGLFVNMLFQLGRYIRAGQSFHQR
jgi:hypothetical protein